MHTFYLTGNAYALDYWIYFDTQTIKRGHKIYLKQQQTANKHTFISVWPKLVDFDTIHFHIKLRLSEYPSFKGISTKIQRLQFPNSRIYFNFTVLSSLILTITIIFKIENLMYSHETLFSNDPSRSRTKHNKQTLNTNKDIVDPDQQILTTQQLRTENLKLKKMLKEAQAKRTHVTKECSQLTKTIEQLQAENSQLKSRVREEEDKCDGQKYRWEELRFLNKQLSSEIESLRAENEGLIQKLRYSSQVLQRKYEELEEKSYKRMEQCVKRVKKSIHYLETLSAKEIDRTRDILVDNLRKAIELLRGKSYEELPCEGQIEELMNPLRTMQEEISLKTKQAASYKQQNLRLNEQIAKYKSMEKEQIPMFKEAIQKLKKNLIQVRGQLSQNQYQKLQLKKRYEERLKQAQHKYNQVFKECRKIKLEKKIYQNKLAELQADVEEEKERLMGENQMLKKLYHNQDSSESRVSQMSSSQLHRIPHTVPHPRQQSKDKKTEQKRVIKKNYSTNELKTSNVNLKNSVSEYELGHEEVSDYNQQSSALSQEQLKQQIYRIDQQIMEIQKNLTKELEAYR